MPPRIPNDEHFRKLENMYLSAPINQALEPELKVRPGEASLTFEVRPEHFHAAGAVHGSMYFKALDDAAFFAANSLVPDVFVLTASFTMHLLAPVTSGRLFAEGAVVRPGKNLIFAEAVLIDSDDNELARGSGVFARSHIQLTEDLGYRL